MMQIPPPSPTHLSLLTELFSPDKIATSKSSADRNYENGTARKGAPLLEERQEHLIVTPTTPSHPSFALRPPTSTNPSMIRYQQEHHRSEGHPPPALACNRGDERSCVLQPSRPAATPKRMARGRSPSQKIIRNNSNTHPLTRSHSNLNSNSDEENGDPQLHATSGPHTCYSFRTMEKQYEKDTQRMLERIQKSRSFEQQRQPQPQQPQTWNRPAFPSSTHGPPRFVASTPNLSRTSDFAESGFYIGDYDGDGQEDSNEFGADFEHHGAHMFDEEEIFELDL